MKCHGPTDWQWCENARFSATQTRVPTQGKVAKEMGTNQCNLCIHVGCTCWVSLVLSVTLAACGGRTTQEHEVAIRAPSDRPQQEDGANGSETTRHVVATDFTFAFDAVQVRTGTITFLARNDGAILHDFAIQGNGMDQKTTRVKPGHTV
jgi:hypothetical protein